MHNRTHAALIACEVFPCAAFLLVCAVIAANPAEREGSEKHSIELQFYIADALTGKLKHAMTIWGQRTVWSLQDADPGRLQILSGTGPEIDAAWQVFFRAMAEG
jgi:hypothetical protein